MGERVKNVSEAGARAARPFEEGDLCLLIDPKQRRRIMRLDRRQHFHHVRTGRIDHTDIIGKAPGLRIKGPLMGEIVCLRPTFEEFIMRRLKRSTQIIYPKDLGPILLRGDIFPGGRVLESGIGSGSATSVLLRYLGDGELISYEQRPEFADNVAKTLREIEAAFGPFQARHQVEIRDVYEGIDEEGLDAVLLDVPEPHNAAAHAARALRPAGVLLCWLPTALQVYTLVRELQGSGQWAEITTEETLLRNWDVSEGSVRPAHRMVAHTGFLIRARRVEELRLDPREDASDD
ncbi:MAG TPA: tRNA (adenine-N1)-methyltransferase [Acidobacteriota bacterium]|nr:tRNA (adenine-N1)-methyltransferase [Acidobacteriota bacterium]